MGIVRDNWGIKWINRDNLAQQDAFISGKKYEQDKIKLAP